MCSSDPEFAPAALKQMSTNIPHPEVTTSCARRPPIHQLLPDQETSFFANAIPMECRFFLCAVAGFYSGWRQLVSGFAVSRRSRSSQ